MIQVEEIQRAINITDENVYKYFDIFDKEIARKKDVENFFYINICGIVIKIENYSSKLSEDLKDKFDYCITNDYSHVDATIKVWEQGNFKSLISDNSFGLKNMYITESIETRFEPLVFLDIDNNKLDAFNKKTNTYYYGRKEFNIDTIAKTGHIFAQEIARILENHNISLVHSASVGIDGKGILISARGLGGKSTLSISALLDDFDYVSDDYVALKKDNGIVKSYPIYSIITLSQKMIDTMTNLKAKTLYTHPWNNTKKILNISNYHNKFVNGLDIKAVVFPNICGTDKPYIEKVSKGKAITQCIDSTIQQVNKKYDKKYTQQLISLMKDFDFYQINLSYDIFRNVEILKNFIKNL